MTTHRFEAGKRQQLGQINRAEVGHANVAAQPGVDALLHGKPRVLDRHRLARRVNCTRHGHTRYNNSTLKYRST